jgi:tRNA-Thr(GGU) m(6)t(6)A37 methyltransferase TsaA
LVFHEPFRTPDVVRGLDGFSHVWLIWHLHQTADRGWSPTVRPPRLGGNKRVGVFASRSTHRPNALGLSLVRLEGIDDDSPDGPALLLGGIDLVDGTSVFDIKPYLPYAEAVPDAAAGYAENEIPRLPVDVAPAAEAAFSALPPRAQAVIRESLALDPRPAARSGENQTPTIHGAHLCGHNVRFRIDDGRCEILNCEPHP